MNSMSFGLWTPVGGQTTPTNPLSAADTLFRFTADDLNASVGNNGAVGNWVDNVHGLRAMVEPGAPSAAKPTLRKNALGSHSAVETATDAADGSVIQYLHINAADGSPVTLALKEIYCVWKSLNFHYNDYGAIVDLLDGGTRLGFLLNAGYLDFVSASYLTGVRKNGVAVSPTNEYRLDVIDQYMVLGMNTVANVSQRLQLFRFADFRTASISIVDLIGSNRNLSSGERVQMETYFNSIYSIY